MTRTEAIDTLTVQLNALSDDRVAALAELARSWAQPSVYSTLSDTERAEIDLALDELDRGEGVSWDTVKADLEAKIKSARA